ncbi:MAG TPA: TIGR02611 family protein [Actinomycetes bacterium]|nr:TIGR02611 family protein [Actinomycetes bacterium]
MSAPEGPNAEPAGLRHRARRTREHIRRRRTLNATYRLLVLVVGVLVALAGVAMLVLPGPGWLVIILGVAILATEYAWAHRLLQRVKAWAQRAADVALDPRRRRRNRVIAIGTVVAAGLTAWAYIARWGLALPGG